MGKFIAGTIFTIFVLAVIAILWAILWILLAFIGPVGVFIAILIIGWLTEPLWARIF